MKVRITAIGLAVLVALLPLSFCCVSMPQHACCKDRCARAPEAPPLVAIPFAAILLPSSTPAAIDREVSRRSDCVAAATHPRFNPTATIQLRI